MRSRMGECGTRAKHAFYGGGTDLLLLPDVLTSLSVISLNIYDMYFLFPLDLAEGRGRLEGVLMDYAIDEICR